MTQHFQKQYLDDLVQVNSQSNYFMPVWDRVLAAGHVPRNLLDVGCGTGVFSIYAHRKTGCTLSGVDGSDYALQEARKLGFGNVARISDLNNDALPYADASFDFVFCKDVLEHLLNPLHLVRECRRVLAPEGSLLLHVPNHFPVGARLKFLFSGDIDTFRFFPGATRWDFPHVRFFEHGEFVRILRAEGLEVAIDLSACFAHVPLLNRLPGSRNAQVTLAARWPTQFASGFSLLLKRKLDGRT